MTKSKVLTICLIVVLLVLGAAAWYSFGTTNAGVTLASADEYTAGGATVTGRVENLDIDWTSGEVNVEYHSGDGVIVSETADRALSEDEKLRWWLDGTTLRIQYMKPGFRISVNVNKKLTVSLPEGTVLKSADIGVTSAALNLPRLAADEIRLDVTSGDITAVTLTGKLTASSTSGDIFISQESGIGEVDMTSTSGSISCSLGAGAGSVSMHSTSGSISLSAAGSVNTVRLWSTSGVICPDLAGVDKAEFSSTSGGVTGRVAAFSDLKVETTSGKVTLSLPDDPGFTCTVDTAGGSFSSSLALTKNGDTYSCGDGSARCSIDTSSGNIQIEQIK